MITCNASSLIVMESVTMPEMFAESAVLVVVPALVIEAFSNIKRAIYCSFILELKLRVVEMYPSSSMVGVVPVRVMV